MAEAGGTQQNQVDATQARAFVTNFVHDPKLVQTMPEAQVLEYHGKVRTAVDTAVADAIKARGDFGPDWRKTLAGDNAEAMPTLERFQSPKALWDSYSELRGKVSRGELKAVAAYPANGTDEQKAQWRADAGLPSKPEDYKVEPPLGVVLGEADKPYLEGFLKHAHANNMSNQDVNHAVAWWAEERVRRQEGAAQAQEQLKRETEDKLRAEWGSDYRPSMTRIEGMVEALLPADDEDMRKAVMATVQTSTAFANMMSKIAFQLNPTGTGVPLGEEGQLKSVSEWLTKADALMRSDRRAYNASEYSKDYQKYLKAYTLQTNGKEWGKQ